MATPTSTSLVSNVSLLGSNNSVFQGRDGNDTLVGGHGNDSLVGGLGNNTYIVNSFTDTIKESLNGGIDTVQSSVIFALGDNLENLTLTGNSAINGYGNSLNNCIKGNAANN